MEGPEAHKPEVWEADPQLTGVPFNDAYRFMHWMLSVPSLLFEIVLVMKLDGKDASTSARLWVPAPLW